MQKIQRCWRGTGGAIHEAIAESGAEDVPVTWYNDIMGSRVTTYHASPDWEVSSFPALCLKISGIFVVARREQRCSSYIRS